MNQPHIRIPDELLPSDGRFGSGPSKVRPEALQALAEAAPYYLGTSHRRTGVKSVVGRLRSGLQELYALPDGYEVVLGNGGTTYFWDAACFGLIERRSQHLVFGEFSSKFAACATLAPHLSDPVVIESEAGTHPNPRPDPGIDLYALTHNETLDRRCSSGAACAGRRAHGGRRDLCGRRHRGGPRGLRCLLFRPQKGFASDGGLWIALCSPAGIERIAETKASDRYLPPSLDLQVALENSRKDQTYNTPALATLFLMVHQLEWFLDQGGLAWSAGRSARSAEILYGWADASEVVTPSLVDPAKRSPVVATIDFTDSVDAAGLAKILRSNGILDTEPYRKLGRNQLRIAMYLAIEPDDIAASRAASTTLSTHWVPADGAGRAGLRLRGPGQTPSKASRALCFARLSALRAPSSRGGGGRRAGGPVLEAMEEVAFEPRGAAVALKLMGAVHRLVLERKVPELALFYPSVGGTAATEGSVDRFPSGSHRPQLGGERVARQRCADERGRQERGHFSAVSSSWRSGSGFLEGVGAGGQRRLEPQVGPVSVRGGRCCVGVTRVPCSAGWFRGVSTSFRGSRRSCRAGGLRPGTRGPAHSVRRATAVLSGGPVTDTAMGGPSGGVAGGVRGAGQGRGGVRLVVARAGAAPGVHGGRDGDLPLDRAAVHDAG